MANKNLTNAKTAKNDEFYTQYADIQKEINAYLEIFPRIKENKAWLGATGFVTDMVFGVPEGAIIRDSDKKKAERLGYV